MIAFLRRLFCRHHWISHYTECSLQPDGRMSCVDNLYCERCGAERIEHWRSAPSEHWRSAPGGSSARPK